MFKKSLKSLIVGMSVVLVLSFAACGTKTDNGDTMMEDMQQGMEEVKDDVENTMDDMSDKPQEKQN